METFNDTKVLFVYNPANIHSNPVIPILVPRKFKNYNGCVSDLNNISKGSQPVTPTLLRFNPTLLDMSIDIIEIDYLIN